MAPVNYEAPSYATAEELVANYLPGTFDPVTMDGEIYGLPLEFTNGAIYINDRGFWDAGIDRDVDYPKTWEEMIEIPEKIVIGEGSVVLTTGIGSVGQDVACS